VSGINLPVVILHLCKKENGSVMYQNVTQVNSNVVHGMAIPTVHMYKDWPLSELQVILYLLNIT
jgi:hypothetical protein